MAKTRTKQHYRPVAEFDEVTQASKREYWRTKKREQRAKLSMGKRKSRLKNCKPLYTSLNDKPVSHIPHSKPNHTLLNTNGSYQADATRKPFKEELKSLSHKELHLDAPMVELGGVSKGLPVSTACMKLNSTENNHTQTRSPAFNGNFCTTSKQPRVPKAVSQFAPRCNTQLPPKVKCSVPPRSLATEYRLTNANRKAYNYVAQCKPRNIKTMDLTMTEEETVAKRRENWRIKKREQRAKRAQMLKMTKERKEFSEKGQKKAGKLSCTVPTHPLLSVNTMVLRRGKQPTSAMSVQCVVNMGKNNLLQSRQTQRIQQPLNSQSLPSRNLNLAYVGRLNNHQDSQFNHMAISSRVSVQPAWGTHNPQSKVQPPKFIQIQRRQHAPQWNNRAETAEERLAKQREYWRIKKRIQRAKHSIAAKTHLKEQNAFNWRAKCYQSIMEQIRKTPTSFQNISQPNRNMLSNTSSAITGFIQEDGTVSAHGMKTQTRRLPPHSYGSPAEKASYSHSQKIANIRARPVLHSLPNNTNSSMNTHQTTASLNVSAFDPILRSKQANSTSGTEVPKSLLDPYQIEKSTKDQPNLKRNVSRMEMTSAVSTSYESPRQDSIYPSIASVFSLSEESPSTDRKDIKPAPSPTPDAESDTEPCSISDNQATTLLVVASMQRLLEESLSSVVDNSSSTSEDKLLLWKTEDDPSIQEEDEKDSKPDCPTPHEVQDCPNKEVKQSPSPYPSVSQRQHFSSSSTSHTELPCNKRNGQPVLVGVNPSHKGNRTQNSRATIPQKRSHRPGNGSLQLKESSDLQKKREYWRLMKRQQRARKAKEKEKSKNAVQHSQQMQRKRGNFQFPHPSAAQSVSHTDIINHVIQATVPSRPARPVLSPATSANQQPSSILSRQILSGGQQSLKKSLHPSRANKWHSRCPRPAPTLSAKPGAVTLNQINHDKLTGPSTKTGGTITTTSKSHQRHFVTSANEELDPEEIIHRKRMLWRIKKQEQRARKAAQEKELRQQRILCPQLDHSWSNNNADAVQTTPLEKLDYVTESYPTTSLKDEPDVCVVPDDDCSDEHFTEARWRSRYLMDYDPVNQLLVCMVCGEQQYTLSAEAVRAHIQETHPSTLCLEDMERECIQQAWDQQVAMRERFYTNQLWQNNDASKEQSLSHTAEIEVILEADDKSR